MKASLIEGSWVLITGAAGGIGRALAREFHSRKARLILTDVDSSGLEEIATELRAAGAEVVCFEHDVSDPEAWTRLADELDRDGRSPRVLVNNAGIAVLGLALDLSMEAWRSVMDVDLWGVIHGCRTMVPRMLDRGEQCAVINIASCAAYLGGPLAAPYFIAKAGVLRLTQSLQTEVDPDRVSFTVVCPGRVETGIGESSARRGSQNADTSAIVKWLAPPGRSPETVAKCAVRGLLRRSAVVNVFWDAALMNFATRILPYRWIAKLSRRYFTWNFPEFDLGAAATVEAGA